MHICPSAIKIRSHNSIPKPHKKFMRHHIKKMCATLQVGNIKDRYDIIKVVGKGTYGKVYKCRDKKNPSLIIALKKIKILQPSEGFPLNSIREINILKSLHHDNIIGLREIITTKDDRVYLAFDYCEHDLFGLIYSAQEGVVTELHLVSYIKQLLVAIKVCQNSNIVHRDLKPANIFLTANNVLKLGDFGLARRIFENQTRYTSKVITLYYRAPELLLDCRQYKYEVDIWSVGCIIYEILTKKPLFQCAVKSNEAIPQAQAIFNICGTPDLEEWPEFKVLDKDSLFVGKVPLPNKLRQHLESTIPEKFKDSIDLLLQMLHLTPSKRISAEDAIMHPFIAKYGDSIEPSKLPPINSTAELHQLDVSNERKKRSEIKQPIPRAEPQKPPEIA